MDEEQRRVEVVVPDEQLCLAIGRRGQNVRLGSQLTGWEIDILTEAEESERRHRRVPQPQQDVHRRARHRRGDRATAGDRGFRLGRRGRLCGARKTSPISKGLIAEIAEELQEPRAPRSTGAIVNTRSAGAKLGVEDDLAAIEELTPAMLVALGEKGVKTLDDFADLAGDELMEFSPASDKGGVTLDLETANALIMRARAHWFEDEATSEKQE